MVDEEKETKIFRNTQNLVLGPNSTPQNQILRQVLPNSSQCGTNPPPLSIQLKQPPKRPQLKQARDDRNYGSFAAQSNRYEFVY